MKKHSLLIIAGAAFWGVMGIFSRAVESLGYTTLETSAWRIVWAAVIMSAVMFVKDKSIFRVKIRDLPLLIVIGVISIFAMSVFYLSAISSASLSVAAILLYTAPFFVTAASAVVYKEKITVRTSCALIIAFLGCVLIAGIGGHVTALGLFYGIMAGITYASYSILGKKALEKYSPYTVTVWSFIFAALSALIAVRPGRRNTKNDGRGSSGAADYVFDGSFYGGDTVSALHFRTEKYGRGKSFDHGDG